MESGVGVDDTELEVGEVEAEPGANADVIDTISGVRNGNCAGAAVAACCRDNGCMFVGLCTGENGPDTETGVPKNGFGKRNVAEAESSAAPVLRGADPALVLVVAASGKAR
jgi:hypothetical protein